MKRIPLREINVTCNECHLEFTAMVRTAPLKYCEPCRREIRRQQHFKQNKKRLPAIRRISAKTVKPKLIPYAGACRW